MVEPRDPPDREKSKPHEKRAEAVSHFALAAFLAVGAPAMWVIALIAAGRGDALVRTTPIFGLIFWLLTIPILWRALHLWRRGGPKPVNDNRKRLRDRVAARRRERE